MGIDEYYNFINGTGYYEEPTLSTQIGNSNIDFYKNGNKWFYNFTNSFCCFDAGTQVLMANGSTKSIENVNEGDMIMSLNEDTGEFIPQKVMKCITKHNSDDLVYVNLSNGTKIGMRAYHPLLTTDGWKSLRPNLVETNMDVGEEVKLLEVNDILVGYQENVKVISIDQRPNVENYDTYNLSIKGYNNYIVNGIVVHNAAIPCEEIK